jgi:GT2 family glycosyltransferase
MMHIAIIVLHYKNLPDTLECLHSLAKIDYPSFEIILIDNGSSDDLAVAYDLFTSLTIVRNAKNLGFAEGCNRGLSHALLSGAQYMLLLNNDTVVDPTILSSFVQAAQDNPSAGAFGAKIFYYDHPTLIWHAGGNVHLYKLRCYHEGCLDCGLDKKWEDVREIAYACGCALFIKASVFEKVGPMAPEFFLIWEEIDWCFRMRKQGYPCLFVPAARVWHKISRSFEEGHQGSLWQYYYHRNRLFFLKRHISLGLRWRFYCTRFPKEALILLWNAFYPGFSQEHRRRHRYALQGVCDYFLGKFHEKNHK